MNDPIFLTVDDVLELHEDQIETYGGDLGIRDMGSSNPPSRCLPQRMAASFSIATCS